MAQKVEKASSGKQGVCEVCGKVFDQVYRPKRKIYTSFKKCANCRLSAARKTSIARIPYEPHINQESIHASTARFKVLNAGTRFGKDRCFVNEFIKKFCEMLSEKRSEDLIPAVHGWIIAPTFTMARQVWRELMAFFPREWIDTPWMADKMISTINDGIIEVRSADDPEGLVGVGLDIVLVTEAARIKHFDEVWTNLENRLMSPGRGPNGEGGIGLINSTPRGRNFFYKMYKWGQKDDPEYDMEWESWRYTTFDNPLLTRKDKNWIERLKKRYPERIFQQEIMAKFLAEGNSMFPKADDCATYSGDEKPVANEIYVIGYDPAKSIDNAGVAVRNTKGQTVKVEQWKGMGWEAQYDRITLLSKIYNNALIVLDKTGLGETIPTQLMQRGLNVDDVYFTASEKEKLVNNLAMLIEQEKICYPDYEPLIDELKDYEYTVTRAGNMRYGASSARKHDDLVTAMMLAFKDFVTIELALPWVGAIGGIAKHV